MGSIVFLMTYSEHYVFNYRLFFFFISQNYFCKVLEHVSDIQSITEIISQRSNNRICQDYFRLIIVRRTLAMASYSHHFLLAKAALLILSYPLFTSNFPSVMLVYTFS